jgi:hypothetical protein
MSQKQRDVKMQAIKNGASADELEIDAPLIGKRRRGGGILAVVLCRAQKAHLYV